MKRSKRLLNIIKIAERKEQDMAKRLLSSRQSLKQCQEQLSMLNMYLEDYLQKFSLLKKQSKYSYLFKNYQDFILTIEKGIVRQQQLIVEAETVVKQHEQNWTRAHAKVASFKHIQQKFKKEEDSQQDRLEQRMIDDYVSRPR